MSSTINNEIYYNLTLDEIMVIEDANLKEELLNTYRDLASELKSYGYSDINSSYTLNDLVNGFNKKVYYELEREQENTGEYFQFLYGHTVSLYGNPKLIKAKKIHRCSFCSHIIIPGERYYLFRPLLYDKTQGEAYILSSNIKLREFCDHQIPSTINELETLQYGMDSCYEYPDINSEWFARLSCNHISFEEMSVNLGGGFNFVRLKRKKDNVFLKKKR